MQMNAIAETTLTLLLLVAMGTLLRSKLKQSHAMDGMKLVILSVALPSTIFLALLQVDLDLHLIYLVPTENLIGLSSLAFPNGS